MHAPETHYARSGDVHIAYQIVGAGPLDLVWVPGFVSHLELNWEAPPSARLIERLAGFSRLILFDKRGTGLSDRVPDVPSLEQRMDDVRAVLDAVGSRRAVLFGVSEGGPMAALFAATYPERTEALVLYGSFAEFSSWIPSDEALAQLFEAIETGWGTGVTLSTFAPSHAQDEQFRRRWARWERLGASPGAAVALMRMNSQINISHVLPAIRVPTLILHRSGDPMVNVQASRFMATQIPGARYVELPGDDHLMFVGDADALVDEIEVFLTGTRSSVEPERVLATVLFVDMVGSTERAARLGDRSWRDLLTGYYALVRQELARFRGREVKLMGDGVLATFDGPARAVRCACAIRESVGSLGIATRAGLHTGECEVLGDDIGGIAVHIGARVSALAAAGEVLVSSTVKDLVAGSGLRFEARGIHRLKGIPDDWRLYRVAG